MNAIQTSLPQFAREYIQSLAPRHPQSVQDYADVVYAMHYPASVADDISNAYGDDLIYDEDDLIDAIESAAHEYLEDCAYTDGPVAMIAAESRGDENEVSSLLDGYAAQADTKDLLRISERDLECDTPRRVIDEKRIRDALECSLEAMRDDARARGETETE